MTRIQPMSPDEAKAYIEDLLLTEDERYGMNFCLKWSSIMWVGHVDSDLCCMWGLIPPTLMSNQAYFWLQTTDLMKDHPFILVRHSQLVIEQALELYPSICGHVNANAPKSIRWLKWLGAKFGTPAHTGIPFRITRDGRRNGNGGDR